MKILGITFGLGADPDEDHGDHEDGDVVVQHEQPQSDSLKPADFFVPAQLDALDATALQLSRRPLGRDESVQALLDNTHELFDTWAAHAKQVLGGLRANFSTVRQSYEMKVDESRFTAIIDNTRTAVKAILGRKADRMLTVETDAAELDSKIYLLTVGITGTPDGEVKKPSWWQEWGAQLLALAVAVAFEFALSFDVMQYASSFIVAGVVALTISGSTIWFTMNVANYDSLRHAQRAARTAFNEYYGAGQSTVLDPKSGQKLRVLPIDGKTRTIAELSRMALFGFNGLIFLFRLIIVFSQETPDYSSILGTVALVVVALALYLYKLKNSNQHPRAEELLELKAELVDLRAEDAKLQDNTSTYDTEMTDCVAKQQGLLDAAGANTTRATADQVLSARDEFRARQAEYAGGRPWFVQLSDAVVNRFLGLVRENPNIADAPAYQLGAAELQVMVERELPVVESQPADAEIISYMPQTVHVPTPSINLESLVDELWAGARRDAAENARLRAAQSGESTSHPVQVVGVRLADSMLRRS